MPENTALIPTLRRSLPATTGTKTRGRYQGQKKLSGVRMRVIKAYEKNCGNVSATCEEVGIHRMTFYRWLESPTEVNKKFREHLERIRPDERYADAIEAAHMKKLVDKDSGGDVAAIIFGLKTKAKHRGWNEREFVIRNEAEADEVAKLKSAIADRAQALGITYQEELRKFLSMFGKQLAEPVVEKLEGEL